MHSCIYVGRIHHRRHVPLEHGFRYRLYMLYVDLDELPRVRRGWLLPEARFAPVAFRRDDHMKGTQSSLSDAVRELVESRTGERPAGPIRLLTGPRCFGYYFSPLNLYYCFDPGGGSVRAVVAEVSNTPWREVHYYVLSDGNRTGESGELCFTHPKDFHVSPFMDMDLRYDWRLCQPGSRLAVEIDNFRQDELVFEARLELTRRELRRTRLLRMLLQHPWMTGRIIQGIYFQAFRLWRKKCPFYPHPEHLSRPPEGR